VEAGLRSYNRVMPEEINRIVADQLSTVLFCPTRTAEQNLAREGFPHRLSSDTVQKIFNVGDVMYDAALFYAAKAEENSRIMQALGLTPKGFVLATIHRAENTDHPDRLTGIMAALEQIAQETPVVLPLHPRTRKCLEKMRVSCKDPQNSLVRFVDPVGYLDMVMLEKNARVIITDSGGVQKEAYFHGVPCVTVREETEWVELVDAGVNVLAGAEKQHIIQSYRKMEKKNVENLRLYGDGHSAEKILETLCRQIINYDC